MSPKIRIRAGNIDLQAELNDTKTATALYDILPLEGKANTWGEEIYFPIPLYLEIEGGKEVVEMGDLGYWPDGNSLCIFFGPTPASRKNEIRAASPVTVIGRLTGNPKLLKQISSGTMVIVEQT
ncbi:MAG: hypothetical protein A2Y72_06550 [Chloroflexi bacterium RBG_13_53_26]|nr:MAG: hypothetical protein A2Y72_06550 [Chloroflexi bacterium RBG_13_53_26]